MVSRHGKEFVVLGPQGTLFFLLLLLAFAGLVVWIALARHVALRVLAACLAFIPAMVFGVAMVNKYYDYYQTWGALLYDLSGQSSSVPQVSAAGLGTGKPGSLQPQLDKTTSTQLDAQYGLLFQTTIAWPQGHISRQAYVYLPPQYFSKAYADYRFPAIELLHGSPGQPSAWVNVMDVIPAYLQLLAQHKARPAVLVMPNTDGGQQYALQCLNNPGGIQDMTYVAQVVPDWIAATLRVQPPGRAWGVAGYSEGGYCAANIGLQYASRFRYVGVLSGYFAPGPSQIPVGNKVRDVNVFRGHPSLEALNTPADYVMRIPVNGTIPYFFLAAGSTDLGDVRAAQFFRQELMLRNVSVPLDIVSGTGHTALVWRSALSPMLEWMTPQLAQAAESGKRGTRTLVQRTHKTHL